MAKTEKIAKNPFSGSADAIINFTDSMQDLVFVNRHDKSATVEVNGQSFVIGPNSVFDEEIEPFRQLEITATGPFHGYVRKIRMYK